MTTNGEWRSGGSILAHDDELVALNLCVIDSARLEVLTDQPDGDLLDSD